MAIRCPAGPREARLEVGGGVEHSSSQDVALGKSLQNPPSGTDNFGMRRLVLLVTLLLVSGCSSAKPEARKTLSQRDRDSVLALQPLPGSKVVGRALRERSRLESRASTMDARVDSLTR